MPYAPTVNDNSGQILAQGINQGIGSLAEGIQRSIAERKKKEEERNAKEAVNAAGKGLFGEDFDVKDAKPEQYSTIIGMAQERANKPLKDAQLAAAQAQQQNYALQMKNQQLEMDRQQRDDAALQAALGGIDAGGGQGPSVGMTESQMGMTGAQPVRGGVTASDAADVFATAARKGASGGALNQLSNIESHRAAAAENRAQAAQRGTPKTQLRPERVDLGGGVVGVWDGNNFSRTNDPKADPNARIEFEVGGVNMVLQGGKLFNAATGELVGPAKPLDADTQSRLASRLSAAQEIADKPQGWSEGKTTFEKRVRDAQLKANLAAASLGLRSPYPPAETPPGRVGAPSPAAKRFQIVAEPSK